MNSTVKELPAWRARLGRIIQDIEERRRLADDLSINAMTLVRWAKNTSNPRYHTLEQLVALLPEHQTQLRREIVEEFEDFVAPLEEEPPLEAPSQDLPSEFYARMVAAYTTTLFPQRFWTLSNLILQQALGQLDPRNQGLAVAIVQCMPPSGEQRKVRSLRIRVGHGTPPWTRNLEQHPFFLGRESLSGYVTSTGQPRVAQHNKEHQSLLPTHWTQWEKSAAAYPILCANQVAGCLLVSSTQPDFFLPYRRILLEEYTKMSALLFEPEEFYDLETIQLSAMPFYRAQEEYVAHFSHRVSALILEAVKNHQSLSLIQAQQAVWQQLEEELLQLPSSMSNGNVITI